MKKFFVAAMIAAFSQMAYASDKSEVETTQVKSTPPQSTSKTCWKEQVFEPVAPAYGDDWTVSSNGNVRLTRVPCPPPEGPTK